MQIVSNGRSATAKLLLYNKSDTYVLHNKGHQNSERTECQQQH